MEAEKKKEAEDRKRKTEDKNEAEQKAKAQKEEEKRRKNTEELAAAEEERQRKGEKQARAKVEQLKQEEERMLQERPAEDTTAVEMRRWADMLAETGKKREMAEEKVGKAYHGVGIGSGWEVNEGKAMRTVEVTTHFWTPVTEEEKTKLREKIGVVANLLVGLRKAEGKGVWSVKATVHT